MGLKFNTPSFYASFHTLGSLEKLTLILRLQDGKNNFKFSVYHPKETKTYSNMEYDLRLGYFTTQKDIDEDLVQ